MVHSFKEKSLEHQHGILLAVGYAFGLNILKNNKDASVTKDWQLFRDIVVTLTTFNPYLIIERIVKWNYAR